MGNDHLDESDSDSEESDSGDVHEVGRWRSKKSGKLLGSEGKAIKFTVIGLVISRIVLLSRQIC